MHRIGLPETLTIRSLEELEVGLERAAADAAARAWALVGAPGVFCRGMDLSALTGETADTSMSLRRFAACLSRLRHAPRPTLALVDGEALGGGVGLAAACDVVLATPRASFALPEALFGLLPGVVMPVLLERMRSHDARLFALLGARREGAWAKERGLADELVAAEDLEHAAARAVRELGRANPDRVAGLRAWMAEIPLLAADAALARGAGVTAELVRDASVREAVRGFVEEGTPPWLSR